MGGQGFFPEDGGGAMKEGDAESKKREKELAWEKPTLAPTAGKQPGVLPDPELPRPGVTPEEIPRSAPPAGSRVQDPSKGEP